ncbi:MAG TPA: hypothetical protein PLA50_11325 [Bacteroidia bacterium]|nr:hypothetical protein [Bacteroidia bacterium]
MAYVIMAVFAFLALVSCVASAVPIPSKLFALRPFGEKFELFETHEQEGDGTFSRVATGNFVEATIAQGSGFSGFDSIRIHSSGSAEIVFGNSGEDFRKVETKLNPSELEGLFEAFNRDGMHEIKGSYRTRRSDGVQGFVELVTREGRRFCRMDNYFEPLQHTYEYCNRVIVPKLASATLVKGRMDPQAEYHRIFYPEQARSRRTR